MYTCTTSEFLQNFKDHHSNVQKLKINRNAGMSQGKVNFILKHGQNHFSKLFPFGSHKWVNQYWKQQLYKQQ